MGQYHPPPAVLSHLPLQLSSSPETPLFSTTPHPGLPQPQPLGGGQFPIPVPEDGRLHCVSHIPAPSWPGLFLESARWLIVKRQIEEAQSVLRILAERNRPHGQMLGEEAQEALQGRRQGSLHMLSHMHT